MIRRLTIITMLLTGLAAFGQDRMSLSEAIRTARTNLAKALKKE